MFKDMKFSLFLHFMPDCEYISQKLSLVYGDEFNTALGMRSLPLQILNAQINVGNMLQSRDHENVQPRKYPVLW